MFCIATIAMMEIEMDKLIALEKFFNSIDMPVRIKLHNSITYNDPAKFIKENLNLLKRNELQGLCAKVSFNNLLDLKSAMEGLSTVQSG